MRKEFFGAEGYTAKRPTRKEAEAAMPWAAKIVKVEGGYMGFESMDDYKTWKAQR